MDPINVAYGLCRLAFLYTRYPYYLQDDLHYRSRDYQEFVERKDLDLDLEVNRQDMHGCSGHRWRNLILRLTECHCSSQFFQLLMSSKHQ
jgi:hypothetical protein